MNTKKTMQEMNEQFKNCPTEKNLYEIDGHKCVVVRHFTGNKTLNETMLKYAFERAFAETIQSKKVC